MSPQGGGGGGGGGQGTGGPGPGGGGGGRPPPPSQRDPRLTAHPSPPPLPPCACLLGCRGPGLPAHHLIWPAAGESAGGRGRQQRGADTRAPAGAHASHPRSHPRAHPAYPHTHTHPHTHRLPCSPFRAPGLPHAQHQDRVCVLPLMRAHSVRPPGACWGERAAGGGAACPLLLPLVCDRAHLAPLTHPHSHAPTPHPPTSPHPPTHTPLQDVTEQIRQRTGHLPGEYGWWWWALRLLADCLEAPTPLVLLSPPPPLTHPHSHAPTPPPPTSPPRRVHCHHGLHRQRPRRDGRRRFWVGGAWAAWGMAAAALLPAPRAHQAPPPDPLTLAHPRAAAMWAAPPARSICTWARRWSGEGA